MLDHKIEDYEDDPVVFCNKCLSLSIKHSDIVDTDYCSCCGCSDISEAPIAEWENKYKKKYGKPYVVKSNDIKKNPIFLLTRGKLMTKLASLPQWKEIIKKLYPRFPNSWSKADSIILLFDKLTKDNRMDDLRITILNYTKV